MHDIEFNNIDQTLCLLQVDIDQIRLVTKILSSDSELSVFVDY